MPWFVQKTGNFYDDKMNKIGTGVSGHPPGTNNPDWEKQRGVGPLPVGTYHIGPAFSHPHLGPVVMALGPDDSNHMYSRSGFFIHGFSATHYDYSSDGCICLERTAREAISKLLNRELRVVHTEDEAAKQDKAQ